MTRVNHYTVRNSDIICGRGKGYDRYAGNQAFRDVINEHSATYIGFGTNRIAKANTIQKIFEDIVIYKNMRFVTHAKKRGWVLMEEREIKLKIGHALRDVNKVRQKQAEKRQVERKQTKKEPTVTYEAPVELTGGTGGAIEPSKNSIAPQRPQDIPCLRQEEAHTIFDCVVGDSAHSIGVDPCTKPREHSRCCNCHRSAMYDELRYHGKQDNGDGLALLYDMLKNIISRGQNGCCRPSCASFAPNVDPISQPFKPSSAPAFDPLPLSCDASMDKEGLQALSSLCSSLGVEDAM